MDSVAVNKKHVLLVSAQPRALAELKLELKDHFDISIAATAEAAIAAVDTEDVAIVVIYISDNREKAFSVFTSIHESVHMRGIPIIFLAEKGKDDDETTAFAIGAVDYSARRPGTVSALVSRIKLRISASEKRDALGEGVALSREASAQAYLAGKTILVAEDVEINREIVLVMLSEIEGLEIQFAVNGREALEMFTSAPDLYAFIIMDVQMPVMDGLEATRAIRRLQCSNARSIPIIALTASVEEEDIARCLESGMHDYIEKPFSCDRFLAVVAQHCV